MGLIRKRLRAAADILLGPACFAVVKLGAAYAARRELGKADRVGPGTTAREGFSVANEGRLEIGSGVSFGLGVELIVYAGGRIVIGDNVFVGNGCVIHADRGSISIGDDTLIAEHVSIRASNHGKAAGRRLREQPNRVEDVVVGSDVWLGKGAIICAGAKVGDGCIIGANSVVNRETEPQSICAGAPARPIGRREGPPPSSGSR